MKGGPAAHKESVRRARKADEISKRRAQAWTLHLGGATFDEIGRQLGVSNYTAWHDVFAVFEARRNNFPQDAELQLAIVNGQLDALLKSHWNKRGDSQHAAVVTQVLAQKRKLNGLDRERKDVYTLDQVRAIIRTVETAFLALVEDVSMRQRFAVDLRRLGPVLAPTIDVTKVEADE